MPTTSSTDRQRLADQNRRLGHSVVNHAPDNGPAIRLRAMLEQDRKMGISFDPAWSNGVELVVGSLDGMNADQWREAFMATKTAWRSGFDRSEASVSSLRVDLLAA